MRSRDEFYELPQAVQDEWVADWLAENDKSVEFDPEVVWYPHRLVNRRVEATEWFKHEYDKAHSKKPWRNADFSSWSKERDDAHPHHMWDGVQFVATQDKPTDDDWFSVLPSRLGGDAEGDEGQADDSADEAERPQ